MSPDKKNKANDWRKSHILRLADDITITPVAELPESMREEILKNGKTADGYYGIERKHVRALPKIVNQNIVDVLRAFGETGATYQQVFEHFVRARNLKRDEFDANLSRLVTNLIHSSFLVDGNKGNESGADSIEPSFEPGDEWLDYRVIENVKTMVDSEIYKVEHLKTGQHGALKIMQSRFPNKGMKKKIRERLQHEFAVIQKINHPNVVRLHAHGTHKDRKYGILHWVEGPTVREFVHKSDQKPDPEIILGLAAECVQALGAVHEVGYLHGDVHTGNFLVRQGHICLIDFGLSRPIVIPKNEKSKYNEGGVVLYMPPEYVRMAFDRKKGLWGSVRGEVYSLGVVLFSLFTKRYPYKWKFYRKDYMRSVLYDPPLSFEECDHRTWPELETVIRMALAKDKQDRFASMWEFAKALKAVKASPVKQT